MHPRAVSKPTRRPPKQARRRVGKGSGAWLKWIGLPVLLLVVLVSAVGGYLYYGARSSLPQMDGAARLAGLSAPVSVLRDARGVPHLFGSDIRDLARATGYVHAQDRYFQMELSRRLGAGRLAEVFGPEAVEQDRSSLRLGLAAAADAELARMAPEAREVLEAYATGVNGFREANLENLPPEFGILDLTPAPRFPPSSTSWAPCRPRSTASSSESSWRSFCPTVETSSHCALVSPSNSESSRLTF